MKIPARLPTVLLSALLFSAGAQAQLAYEGDEASLAPLGAEISRLAEAAKGTVGVAAYHLESGRGVYLNGGDRFPMASTYKVPIAVKILAEVDAGDRALSDHIAVRPRDIVDTHGAIRDFLHNAGAELTVHDLLEMMLRISDNIATDILLETAGGGGDVTKLIAKHVGDGIRVDRSTRQIIGNWLGRATPDDGWIPAEEFNALVDPQRLASMGPETTAKLNIHFNADPQDTATPRGMAALLEGIWREKILSPASSHLLIDIMERCDTGELRLKGALPPGTVVAHKTGTIGETTNDAGVIYLPGDLGHVITVVYIKESKLGSNEAMEPVIAQIARAIHDYFVLNQS